MTFLEFIKTIRAIKSLIEALQSAYQYIRDLMIKKKQAKEVEQAKEAVQELDEANKTEDENERLKKKAEAACKLEKAINPDATCSVNDGKH